MKSNQEERELCFEHLEPLIEPYIASRDLLIKTFVEKLLEHVDEEFLHRVKYGICSPEEMKISEQILRNVHLLFKPESGSTDYRHDTIDSN